MRLRDAPRGLSFGNVARAWPRAPAPGSSNPPLRRPTRMSPPSVDATSASPKSLFDVLDKIVAVGHLDLRQRLGVDHVVLADDLVEVEEISGNGVSLIVRQRFRFLVGHRREHVIKDGRSIGPEGPDRLDGRVASADRALDAGELQGGAAFALLAVAAQALRHIDRFAL